MSRKEKRKKLKEHTESETLQNETKQGEFVCSYFEWLPLPKQKSRAEELNNMTKEKK